VEAEAGWHAVRSDKEKLRSKKYDVKRVVWEVFAVDIT
jgi:hypothetical protein